MIVALLNDHERINETPSGYETERRYGQLGDCEWRPFEWHETLKEAIQAAAYRAIHSLPNADLEQWYEASGKIITRYEAILCLSKLEPFFSALQGSQKDQVDRGSRD